MNDKKKIVTNIIHSILFDNEYQRIILKTHTQ